MFFPASSFLLGFPHLSTSCMRPYKERATASHGCGVASIIFFCNFYFLILLLRNRWNRIWLFKFQCRILWMPETLCQPKPAKQPILIALNFIALHMENGIRSETFSLPNQLLLMAQSYHSWFSHPRLVSQLISTTMNKTLSLPNIASLPISPRSNLTVSFVPRMLILFWQITWY